jgi:hypothetical protein
MPEIFGDLPVSLCAAVCRSLQAFASLKGQEKGNVQKRHANAVTRRCRRWNGSQFGPPPAAATRRILIPFAVTRSWSTLQVDTRQMYTPPGVQNRGGGPDAEAFDLLAALSNWVEKERAPHALTASKLDSEGKVPFTRPLCEYPEYPG